MMRSAHTTDLGVLPDDQVEAPSHESWNTFLREAWKMYMGLRLHNSRRIWTKMSLKKLLLLSEKNGFVSRCIPIE